MTSSADAAAGAAEAPVPGRVLMVSWYAKTMPGEPTPPGGQGSRISVVDLETRRYDHVLLVRAQADGSWKPLQVHAGGIAWVGSWLHVAATAKGFWSARVDDVVEVPAGRRAETFGHRWVLPVRRGHAAGSGEGVEPLRYSFLSVDASPASPASPAAPGTGPELVVGEYARGRRTRRLARFALTPEGAPVVGDDGRARPLSVHDSGVAGMQGAVVSRGRWHVTTSHGPWTPGTLVTAPPPTPPTPGGPAAGRPRWVRRTWRSGPATPPPTTGCGPSPSTPAAAGSASCACPADARARRRLRPRAAPSRAGAPGPRGARRSPRPRSPPRTCPPRGCGWRGAP